MGGLRWQSYKHFWNLTNFFGFFYTPGMSRVVGTEARSQLQIGTRRGNTTQAACRKAYHLAHGLDEVEDKAGYTAILLNR